MWNVYNLGIPDVFFYRHISSLGSVKNKRKKVLEVCCRSKSFGSSHFTPRRLQYEDHVSSFSVNYPAYKQASKLAALANTWSNTNPSTGPGTTTFMVTMKRDVLFHEPAPSQDQVTKFNNCLSLK